MRWPILAMLLLMGIGNAPFSGSARAQASAPEQAVTIAKKLELLQRYLDSKSSEKITASGNGTAIELLARARERGGQAFGSYNRGNMAIASERLDEAFRAYSEALDVLRSSLAGDEEIVRQNAELREEIQSYLQAFDEALLAKGPSAANLLNRGRFEELLEESRYLERDGDPHAAHAKLKDAYGMAIDALSRIRESETVVYSLDFRTPADEYRYEQNRHLSYSMLVQQMRSTTELSEQAVRLADRYADEGAKLRAEAEAQAAAGEYEAAILTMEEANKRLVRSLQMMGLSIPG
ncbi:MAG: hypothetical protein R3298_01565 [Gammaproteobacteria bacterium]|nr:hypothetical protein [Gammaproteobacteria bacterium]